MIHKNILLTLPRARKNKKTLIDRVFVRGLVKKLKPIYPEIQYTDISKVLNNFHEEIIQEATRNRDGVELPERLGLLFIGACDLKPTNMSKLHIGNVDLWETNCKLCKIFYVNNIAKYPLVDKRLWRLKFAINAANIVSNAFKDNFYRYINIPNGIRVEQILFDQTKNVYAMPDTHENYNSLEI